MEVNAGSISYKYIANAAAKEGGKAMHTAVAKKCLQQVIGLPNNIVDSMATGCKLGSAIVHEATVNSEERSLYHLTGARVRTDPQLRQRIQALRTSGVIDQVQEQDSISKHVTRLRASGITMNEAIQAAFEADYAADKGCSCWDVIHTIMCCRLFGK